MEYINKVQLRGKVGNTKVYVYPSNGVKSCRFSVVTERQYVDKSGMQVVETTWHNCTVFGKSDLPDVETITKGSTIELSGRLRTSRYTTDEGEERTYYDIYVYEFKLLNE